MTDYQDTILAMMEWDLILKPGNIDEETHEKRQTSPTRPDLACQPEVQPGPLLVSQRIREKRKEK